MVRYSSSFKESQQVLKKSSHFENIFLVRQSMSVGWIQHVDCQLEISYLKKSVNNYNECLWQKKFIFPSQSLFPPFLVPCPSLRFLSFLLSFFSSSTRLYLSVGLKDYLPSYYLYLKRLIQLKNKQTVLQEPRKDSIGRILEERFGWRGLVQHISYHTIDL